MNCEHCQPLLLDHLYGLLDGAEAAAVDAHLATCPACAAARADTARVQGLFARAAKSAFPRTTFEAPAPTPQKSGARAPAPAALPFPVSPPAVRERGFSRRIAAALPWAVAAAVLLAIPGTVVPVLGVFDRERAARHDAELAARDVAAAERDIRAVTTGRENRLRDARLKVVTAEQTQTALLDKWVDEQKAAVQAAADRKFTVDVFKPATVQPGAPNDFLLVVNDGRDVWESRRAKMVAEIRASDAVIYTQDLDHEKRGNRHEIRLPAGVWANVKPNAELSLVVAQVDGKTGARTPLQEVRLAGPVFTTLLTTDKPAYRPGERLFFRSLTLDRVTLRPPQREQVLKCELVSAATGRPVSGLTATGTTDLVRVNADGRVEPVRAADGQPVRGVGCGEFVLPADLADGDYTLTLRELPHPGGFAPTMPAPVTRPIKVRAGVVESYAKLIGFTGASYVPGNTVEAWSELKFQDKPVPNAEITGVTVLADGVPVEGVRASAKTDATGRANVYFKLPAEVLDGDVQMRVTFRAGAAQESVAHRVPVVGRRLIVEFFPECGDTLVAGVPCKVYVRATTPAGQPVDISGVITDGRNEVATVKTLRDDSARGTNRGLASFTFTPENGTRVWLKLDSPNGAYAPIMTTAPVHSSAVALMGGPGAVAARTGFPVPLAVLEGVVMSVPDTITSPGQPIRVHLHSAGQTRMLVVGAYVRGRLADTQKVLVEPGERAEVKLMAGADPRGGVVRITAFEEIDAKGGDAVDVKPVAERLVFRRAGELLNLALTVTPATPPAAKGAYTAGSGMTCAVSATDENGAPAAAVLWAAVVNTGVAPSPKDRTLPTHFLLAGDVKNPDELEYADFLLSDHPKAGEALDLVLGTQGWRRFAEQARGKPNYPPANSELGRLKAHNGQYGVWAEPVAAREYRKIADVHAPLYEAAVQAVAQAKKALDAASADTSAATKARELAEVADAAARAASDQQARAAAAQEPVRQFRSAVWYGVAGFGALALLCGGVSLARPQTRLPLGVGTLGSFALAAFLVFAAGWGEDAKATAANPKFEREPLTAAVREPAPPPRPKNPVDAAVPLQPSAPALPTAPPRSGAGVEMKSDGKGSGGGFGGKTAPAPPFSGGGQFVPPRVITPGGPVKESSYPPPPGLPFVRPPEAKGGLGGTPVRPDAPSPPALAPGGIPGRNGWNPYRPNGVSVMDMMQMPAPSNFVIDRAASAGHAADLRQAKDKAEQSVNDRARKLAESLQLQFGARGPAKSAVEPAGPLPVPDGALNMVSVEAFALQQIRQTATPLAPLVVREYAAPRPAPAQPPDAPDSPDTVLWQPVIVLPADGKAAFGFHLGTAPGGYRLVVAGHTADGRLGEARAVLSVSPAQTVAPVAPVAPPGP